MARAPQRGEIWLATLDPTRGHEQAGRRPVLVLSANLLNQGPAGLVVIVPLTRTDRRIPLHIGIVPPEGGIRSSSYIMCEAVRSIARERLTGEAWGMVSATTLQRVEDGIRIVLDLQ